MSSSPAQEKQSRQTVSSEDQGFYFRIPFGDAESIIWKQRQLASSHIRLPAAIWIWTLAQDTPKFLKNLLWQGSHWVLLGTTSRSGKHTGFISETWDLSSSFASGSTSNPSLYAWLSVYDNTYPSMLSVLRTSVVMIPISTDCPVQTPVTQGKKRLKGGHNQIIASDLCKLLNHYGNSHADSLGQKHVKSYVNKLPRQLQFLQECLLGSRSWWRTLPPATLVGHIQKDTGNSLLILGGQTLLTCLKPRRAFIFTGKKQPSNTFPNGILDAG